MDTNAGVMAALEAWAGGETRRWRDTKHAAAVQWAAVLDDDGFSEFVTEITEAAAGGDPAAIRACLREWRVTAGALSGPGRAVLTGTPADGDFTEAAGP